MPKHIIASGDYMYPYVVLVVLGILLLPKVLSLLMPFIAGFFIYLACRRGVRRLYALGINRTVAVVATLLFAAGITAGVCLLVFAVAYNESLRIPELYAKLSSTKPNIPILDKIFTEFKDELIAELKSLCMSLLSYVQNITGFLMSALFALLFAFFFLKDEDILVDIISKNGGERFLKKGTEFKKIITTALGGYFKAQLVLMSITFAILCTFFAFFGVKHTVIAAFITAFVDAIPVFGTGFVLLPWAAYEFWTGSAALGFGLLAAYAVCSLARQFLEPKILSSKIGLPPLFTIFGIFFGYKLFGIAGMLLGPIITLIFVTYIQNLS